MTRVLLFLMCLSPFVTHAGISSLIIALNNSNVPVNTYLDVQAEYVAMPVSLSSDAKHPSERIQLIHQLQSIIERAARNDAAIDLQQGNISLSPRELSSFSISKMNGSPSESKLYILSPITDSVNIFDVTQKLNHFLSSIKLPDETKIRPGNTTLAIKDPDRFRAELIKKIKIDVESTRETLGTDYKVEISGLEGPVLVVQLNDKQVRLFINYDLKFMEC